MSDLYGLELSAPVIQIIAADRLSLCLQVKTTSLSYTTLFHECVTSFAYQVVSYISYGLLVCVSGAVVRLLDKKIYITNDVTISDNCQQSKYLQARQSSQLCSGLPSPIPKSDQQSYASVQLSSSFLRFNYKSVVGVMPYLQGQSRVVSLSPALWPVS